MEIIEFKHEEPCLTSFYALFSVFLIPPECTCQTISSYRYLFISVYVARKPDRLWQWIFILSLISKFKPRKNTKINLPKHQIFYRLSTSYIVVHHKGRVTATALHWKCSDLQKKIIGTRKNTMFFMFVFNTLGEILESSAKRYYGYALETIVNCHRW